MKKNLFQEDKFFGVGAIFLGRSGDSKQKFFYSRPEADYQNLRIDIPIWLSQSRILC